MSLFDWRIVNAINPFMLTFHLGHSLRPVKCVQSGCLHEDGHSQARRKKHSHVLTRGAGCGAQLCARLSYFSVGLADASVLHWPWPSFLGHPGIGHSGIGSKTFPSNPREYFRPLVCCSAAMTGQRVEFQNSKGDLLIGIFVDTGSKVCLYHQQILLALPNLSFWIFPFKLYSIGRFHLPNLNSLDPHTWSDL